MRSLWFKIHLWLGLSLGVLFSVIGVTGSMLVFWREIDEILNPGLMTIRRPVGAAERPWGEIAASARAALPQGATLQQFYWPRTETGVVLGYFRAPAGTFNIFLDPYTARVIGTRLLYPAEHWWGGPFIGIVFKLHYTLLFRTWGVPLVGVLAIGFLALTLTGIYLWWPLKMRRVPDLNLRLHKMAGSSSSLVLVTLLVTGIHFNLPSQSMWLIERMSSVERATIRPTTPGKLTLDEALALAQRTFPDSTPYSLEFGSRSIIELDQVVHVGFGIATSRGLTIDLDTGIMQVADPLRGPAGTAYVQWQVPLHSGGAFGLPGRLLVSLAGLICPLLLITGFNRWLGKRRANNRRAPISSTRSAASHRRG